MRNERAWPQQCWKSCTNGSNIVALRFGDHGTKEMLGVVGWKVWPVSNFAQGVQTDATCNIQQCWELLANNVASVCTMLQVTIYPVIHISSCRAWLQALMLVLPTGFYQLARISGYKGSSLSQFAVPNLTLFKMYLLTFFENCFKPVLQHRFILTDLGWL